MLPDAFGMVLALSLDRKDQVTSRSQCNPAKKKHIFFTELCLDGRLLSVRPFLGTIGRENIVAPFTGFVIFHFTFSKIRRERGK